MTKSIDINGGTGWPFFWTVVWLFSWGEPDLLTVLIHYVGSLA